MIDPQDTSCVLSCQKGELEAFGLLYERYVKRVYDFLFYRTFDESLAQDLTANVFMKALENIESFQITENASVGAWLLMISRNLYIDHWRKNMAHETIAIDEEIENTIPAYDLSFADSLDAKDKLAHVMEFIKTLEKEQQEILFLRIWNDCSYEEIAQITGKTVQNTRQIVSRALKKIQANVFGFIVLLLIIG